MGWRSPSGRLPRPPCRLEPLANVCLVSSDAHWSVPLAGNSGHIPYLYPVSLSPVTVQAAGWSPLETRPGGLAEGGSWRALKPSGDPRLFLYHNVVLSCTCCQGRDSACLQSCSGGSLI